jgi:hypothetical protein
MCVTVCVTVCESLLLKLTAYVLHCVCMDLSLSVCVSVVIVYFDLFLIPCKGGEE